MEDGTEYRRWVSSENNTEQFWIKLYKTKRVVVIMHSEEGFGPFKTNLETVKGTGRQVEKLEKY